MALCDLIPNSANLGSSWMSHCCQNCEVSTVLDKMLTALNGPWRFSQLEQLPIKHKAPLNCITASLQKQLAEERNGFHLSGLCTPLSWHGADLVFLCKQQFNGMLPWSIPECNLKRNDIFIADQIRKCLHIK